MSVDADMRCLIISINEKLVFANVQELQDFWRWVGDNYGPLDKEDLRGIHRNALDIMSNYRCAVSAFHCGLISDLNSLWREKKQ